MSAGGVTAEEMEQAIENARTAVLRDPPWAPNARAFLAILTERDQLNAEVAAIRRQLEERGSPDMVTVPREEREILDAFLSEWVLLQWAEDPRGDGDPAPHRKRIDELFERLDALRSGEDAK